MQLIISVMSATLTQLEFPEISTREWEFAQMLIRDLERDERRSQLAPLLMAIGQWRAAVRTFRRAEMTRMYERQPDASDLRFHRLLVSHLISTGESLAISAASLLPVEEQDRMGLRTADMDAMVAALADTMQEWHSTVDEKRIVELQARIFRDGAS
jgi:hypothetical protein